MRTNFKPYTIEIDIDSPEKAEAFLYAISAPVISRIIKNIEHPLTEQLNKIIKSGIGDILYIPIDSIDDVLGIGLFFNHPCVEKFLVSHGFCSNIVQLIHDITDFNTVSIRYDRRGLTKLLAGYSTPYYSDILIISYLRKGI